MPWVNNNSSGNFFENLRNEIYGILTYLSGENIEYSMSYLNSFNFSKLNTGKIKDSFKSIINGILSDKTAEILFFKSYFLENNVFKIKDKSKDFETGDIYIKFRNEDYIITKKQLSIFKKLF